MKRVAERDMLPCPYSQESLAHVNDGLYGRRRCSFVDDGPTARNELHLFKCNLCIDGKIRKFFPV